MRRRWNLRPSTKCTVHRRRRDMAEELRPIAFLWKQVKLLEAWYEPLLISIISGSDNLPSTPKLNPDAAQPTNLSTPFQALGAGSDSRDRPSHVLTASTSTVEELCPPEGALTIASSEMKAFGASQTNTNAADSNTPSVYRGTRLQVDSLADATQFTASSDSTSCQSDSSTDIEAQLYHSTTPSLPRKFSVKCPPSMPRSCFFRDKPATLFDVVMVSSHHLRSSAFPLIMASPRVDGKRHYIGPSTLSYAQRGVDVARF